MYEINETHDPNLKSWVESANDPNTDFPIQNLPFCVFFEDVKHEQIHIGVVIGDQVLDLDGCYDDGLFDESYKELLGDGRMWAGLDGIMYEPLKVSRGIRARVLEMLRSDFPDKEKVSKHLSPFSECTFEDLPAVIGDYTDFYCSIYHATNVGSMFRPDNPLLPNYKYVPIGYHGRASSIVVSGTGIKRPHGQNRSDA
ncbi:MAG: fumarylacetoacetase, partial [Pyrinomonadaceae bacterium]